MAKRKKPLGCYHCHYVFDAEREQAHADKTWRRERIWRWPPPERFGLELDPRRPGRALRVTPKQPFAAAGLRAGDRILSLGGRPILSALDLSALFEATPPEGARLPLRYRRGEETLQGELVLAKGWRQGTPLEFSWRPSKWQLHPRPGFGGSPLSAKERAAAGLPAKGLAFRVGYIVDWSGVPDPRYGRAARQAGIRKGDLVLGVKGVELRDPDHLHSWWRLTRRPGQVVVLKVRRGKSDLEVPLEVLPPPPGR